MTTNIEQKYKDRKPEETIQIIRDYFESLGFEIEEKTVKQSEIGTWWCRIYLSFDGITCYGQNGKGTTKEYALASGFAELFERYINRSGRWMSKIYLNNILYQLDKNKKDLLITMQNSLVINNLIDKFDFNIYAELIKGHNTTTFPYINLINNEQKEFSPCILQSFYGSSGMAAGNSLEEALVQGISEIYEHYVRNDLYTLNPSRQYYVVDYTKIQLPSYLQQLLSQLVKYKYKIYIFDFSYTHELPVLGLCVIDSIRKTQYFQVGSAPIFEIALERLLTEIYQGTISLSLSAKEFMLNSQEIDLNFIGNSDGTINCNRTTAYAESLLLNMNIVDNFNKKCFLPNKQYSNIELLSFYKKICKKKQWDIYYYNFSPITTFVGVHIFLSNIETHHTFKNLLINTPNIIIEHYSIMYNLIKEIFKKRQIETKEFEYLQKVINLSSTDLQIYNKFFSLPILEMKFEANIRGPGIASFINLFNTKQECINKANKILEQLSNNPFGMKWRDIVAKYIFLFLYKDSYSKEEIEKLAAIYGHDIQEEDYEIVQHQHLLFQKTCIEPMIEFSNNGWFDKLDKINKGALQK